MTDHNDPVIEPSPDPASDLAVRSLRVRIRQQEILAEVGVLALQGSPFLELLNHTVRLTAEGLEAEFCKVMEYLPAENRLLVRAGVGWDEGIVGSASVGADLASPAGFALHTGKPVISNHLENEERFRTPELLVEHGIRRAMNVILQGDGSPFGVLEVDSRTEGEFGEHDIAFLQGAANILGMAIERQRYERRLKAAVDRNQVLLEDVNHRVKNSLQLAVSMLHLQAKTVDDPVVVAKLAEASSRISTIAHAHDRLSYDTGSERIDLGVYLRQVCDDCNVSPCQLHTETVEDIQIATDRAIPLALIVNELVTNAAKYAYPDGAGGPIRVRLARTGADAILVSVSDQGVGLPADFDAGKNNLKEGKGLGMRIVMAFAKQLDAELTCDAHSGTRFTVLVPLHRA